MIIDFTVKNYRSFREDVTLSLEAENLKGTLKDAIYETAFGSKILPVVGIFGPNASGKTNIIKALSYMQWAVLNSDYLKQPTTGHPLLQPFYLNKKSLSEPSHFEISLWDKKELQEYRYGFEITKEKIISEWLEITDRPQKNLRKRLIFERNLQSFTFDKSVQQDLQHLSGNVLENALAISVFAQFANPIALRFIGLVGNENMKVYDGASGDATHYAIDKCVKDPKFSSKVVNFLKKLDISIEEISFTKDAITAEMMKQFPDELRKILKNQKDLVGYNISTSHKMHNDDGTDISNEHVMFRFGDQESFGTQKLFSLAAVVIETVDSGGTLIFDELGSSLHPFLAKAIVDLFQDKKTNRKGAQLIFSSHETYLLTKKVGLRRDQIWFTEKSPSERSMLHSLSEYKTRNDYELAKRYLEGRFGAVPIVEFEDL